MDIKAVENAKAVAASSQPQAAVKPPSNEAKPVNRSVSGKDSVTVSQVGRVLQESKNQAAKSTSERTSKSLSVEGTNQAKLRKKISLDNNQVVTKVIDPTTKDVVRQIPAEEQLRLQKAIRRAAENFPPSDVTE